ncbi:hypothetical protein ACTWP5_23745 [Streptomyces sp. 4N509B]|uniref:hypothetical protein n=1 Tax=Streptomyces sp. 4N509B TaxID=3457413 RepID=UPI003FD60E55
MTAHDPNLSGAPTAPGVPGNSGNDLNKFLFAAIAGSALALLGSFLVWGTAELTVMGETETGEAMGLDGDGMFTLISSIVAIALLAFGMVRKNATLAAISVVPSLVTLIFGVLNALNSERIIRAAVEADAPDGTPSAEIDAMVDVFSEQGELSGGIGLYMVIIGALVALVAGVLVAVKGRANS